MSDEGRATVRIAVIRAWVEAGTVPSDRIRITVADETADGQNRTTVVSSADEACAVIRYWLATGRLDLAEDQENAE